MRRTPAIYHSTSEPYRFIGRSAELAILDEALRNGPASVIALVGPGGQGKTAIVQHWLQQWIAEPSSNPLAEGEGDLQGLFFWSFYRGKDSDLCLRKLYAYAEGLADDAEVSASYCVDHVVPLLRTQRWAVVLDGTEVVQHETGSWFGRFVHPELGRLLEELAAELTPGVVVLTSRFPLPTLANRPHARILSLAALDAASACGLLTNLGVAGSEADKIQAARSCGCHAKAVELLGTYLVRFHQGEVRAQRQLPIAAAQSDASPEEHHVARILAAFQEALAPEARDILALATAFRQPPTEKQLLDFLASPPVAAVLHQTWGRQYPPFSRRPSDWLAGQVAELIALRLLERVGTLATPVIDAHPLVRRGFEHYLGPEGQRQGAQARAGFLRGRPDRRPPASLDEAREEIELFHAYADAGLWNEADGVVVALDNPKHRLLAPALERDLLLRFFPGGDWHKPPLWIGFGRYRSLAMCCEMLGQYADAIAVYPPGDASLAGDALIALGRLQLLLDQPQVAQPWQNLWQAYRAHALCLAGQLDQALALVRSLVPVDAYEWVHVFECLLRAGALNNLDLSSILYQPPLGQEHFWSRLARKRMQADYLRITQPASDLEALYRDIIQAYDLGGLPWERAVTRLSFCRWLLWHGRTAEAAAVNAITLDLAGRHDMKIILVDALEIAQRPTDQLRRECLYLGPPRP